MSILSELGVDIVAPGPLQIDLFFPVRRMGQHGVQRLPVVALDGHPVLVDALLQLGHHLG